MKDDSSLHLPRFSVPQGSDYSLSIKPPLSFSGVTNLVFPLRASLDALQQFCNNYLNIIPRELGYFRVPMPYVYLMLLDYGRMAIDVANVGWLAQREVFFCVPLEWYRYVNGRWVFHDWASICPFIYVDDDLSMATGRAVYGWPKSPAKMTPTVSDWMTDPTSPITEASLSTPVFPELYAGDKPEQRVFLEIQRQRAPSMLRMPPTGAGPMTPWRMATNVAEAIAGYGRDAVGMMAGLGIMPMHPGSSGDNYLAMMTRMMQMGFPMRPNIVANTLNLKQFRLSEDPSRFAFQALTNGPMHYTSFNRAGALGEERILLGDSSAGFTVKLYQWPSLPIVETLGLAVDRKWRGAGVDVVEIKPVLPFWYDVNMTYLPGYNIAWRSRDSAWHDEHDKPVAPSTSTKIAMPALFNTTLGAGNKAVAGPFRFSNTTIRTLPLLADRETLSRFIAEYLNAPLEEGRAAYRFSLWAGDAPSRFAYVYFTATTYGDVTSGTDNIGDWADAEVALLVPVQWVKVDGAKGEQSLEGVGLVPVFTFLDTATAANARSEVLGIPSTIAKFARQQSAWLGDNSPHEGGQETLLHVGTEILPAVGEGQKASRRGILEVIVGEAASDSNPVEWRDVADRWGSMLKLELLRKRAAAGKDAAGRPANEERRATFDAARALSLELLGNRVPFSIYTLKQFRDIRDADRSCYQSIVRVHRTLDEILDLREIEAPLRIRIHEYPTQPLVSLLGLVARPVDGKGGVTYMVQPVRPFWMRVSMSEAIGELMLHRAADDQWHLPKREPQDSDQPGTAMPAKSYFDGTSTTPGVGVGATWLQDHADPRRLADAAIQWRTHTYSGAGQNLTVDEARAAVRAIDPQAVIESILSGEWGNWNRKARWLRRRTELRQKLEQDTVGMEGVYLAHQELAVLQQIVDNSKSAPGKEPADDRLALLKALEPIVDLRTTIESGWENLFRLGKQIDKFQTTHSPDDQPKIAEAHDAARSMLDGLVAMEND